MILLTFLFIGRMGLLGWSVFFSLLSGIGVTLIMVFLNNSLTHIDNLKISDISLFLLLTIFSGVATCIARFLATSLTEKAIEGLRRRLASLILDAPLDALERVGSARLFAVLSDDVNAIKNVAQDVPVLCVQLSVILGCFGYLAWLSLTMLAMVFAVLGIGVISYKVLGGRGHHYFSLALEKRDVLFRHFRALTNGVKEIKLNAELHDTFLEKDFNPTVRDYRKKSIIASVLFIVADSFAQVLFFSLVGIVVYFGSQISTASNETVVSFVVAILFMSRYIESFAGWIPIISRGTVSAKNLQQLSSKLGREKTKLMPDSVFKKSTLNFSSIKLKGVSYTYAVEGSADQYNFGPIDLQINAGEILFIKGGNGSGKTTMAKLLCTLYKPSSGSIYWDNKLVEGEAVFNYRQLFSVIFADFFLFERLPESKEGDDSGIVNDWLAHLGIDKKVTVKDGLFSTVQALSQGQRKRLALVAAYLEDRRIYLFDEWAADQDPEFRHFFYHRILPELKERGKSVIAITHDDSFFHLADRLISMDSGHIVKMEVTKRDETQENFA